MIRAVALALAVTAGLTILVLFGMDAWCVEGLGDEWPACYSFAPSRYHHPLDGSGWSG